MREILFRGKRAENDEWVFGDLRHIFYGECYPHIVDNSNGLNNSVCGLEVDPATVGQFTGLTDCNGVKIFEGDICKVTVFTCEGEDKHFLCDVCFEYSSFIFRGLKSSNFDIPFSNIYDFGTDIEVIGNIYDNPEILKGGDEK